jgi:hypothetical protein
MTQSSTKGPGSPPKPPPTPIAKGVAPRAVLAKAVGPAPVAPAKVGVPTAPTAPKVAATTGAIAPKPPLQPSAPDHALEPIPAWRSVPETSALGAPAPVAIPSVTETAPWRAVPEPNVAPPLVTTPVASAPVNTTAVTPPQPPVGVVTPPKTPATVAVAAVTPPQPAVAAVAPAPPPARAPAVTSAGIAPQPHEDPRALARAAVEDALGPVHQAFRELQRRIEELERRATAAAAAAASPASPVATSAPLALSSIPAPYRPAASIAPIPVTLASLAPRPPVLDVAAIERDSTVSIDGAIDGRRRRLRIALTFVLLLLVVFGGLFAALAYSYTPHTSILDTPNARGLSPRV